MKRAISHQTPSFNLMDWVLIKAIGFYQRRISPRKGWRCAHRVLHGGPSCSGFVKIAIRTYGWREAIPIVKGRFAECKQASRTLRAQRLQMDGMPPNPFSTEDNPLNSQPTPQPPPNGKQSKWYDGCDCSGCDTSWCGCLDTLFDCGPGDGGCIDCNCSPCD